MKSVKPSELRHRGVISASGFLFDLAMLGESEARKRVLALWNPGATVYRLPDVGLLLRLPAPRSVRSETAPGIPLVLQDDCLLATPLHPDEREKLAPPFGSLVLVRGGEAIVLESAAAMREDPISWFDLTGWKAGDVKTLGLPPAPPRHPAAQTFDPRARLQGVPKADSERERIIDAIRKAQAGGTKPGGEGEGFAEKAGRWLRGVARQASQALEVEGDAPSGSSDLYNMARHLTARLAFMTGLAGVIGRRQAEYMRHMMELFERGDLQEALKYAIALGELEDDSPPKPHALHVPTPRENITIRAQKTNAASSIGVSEQLNERLREIYRQAFRKLEQEGRIDEAAFTLAELLGASEEAVNFLEKHGRLRLAAEMAEARNLPPGLVVRQWFLAGDIPRAVLTARRTGAFADAVRRLEQKDAQAASELRRHWADTLAAAGDYAGALEAIAPLLPEMRKLITERMQIIEWLDRAIAAGGPVGAKMLLWKLEFQPDAAGEIRTEILQMLEDENVETAPDRLALAVALCEGKADPLARTLARAAVRALLRDAGNGYGPTDRIVFNKILRFSENAALRADAPALYSAPKADFAAQSPPMLREFTLADSGSLPIYDAAFLPGGRSLIALGEAGIRLLSREGRTVTHFETPAHRLVVSDNGNRALALAPRGEIWRMARLDLLARKAENWTEAALKSFASDYDGSLWFAAIGRDVLALDAAAPRLESLWRLPNLNGDISGLTRSETTLGFLLTDPGLTDLWGRPQEPKPQTEVWIHRLPDLTLRERKAIPVFDGVMAENANWVQTITSAGNAVHAKVEQIRSAVLPVEIASWRLTLTDTSRTRQFTFLSEHPLIPQPPTVSVQWILLATRAESEIVCRLIDRTHLLERAQFRLAGATRAAVRLTETRLTLGDDCGRFLVLDLERGELLRDFRLR